MADTEVFEPQPGTRAGMEARASSGPQLQQSKSSSMDVAFNTSAAPQANTDLENLSENIRPLHLDLCPLCLDVPAECDREERVCPDHGSHASVCRDCLKSYIDHKMTNAVSGYCPAITCPCVHADKQPRILNYLAWSSWDAKSKDTYETLAKDVFTLLCGGCHSNQTVLVCGYLETIPKAHIALQQAMESAGADEALVNDFHAELSAYCDGKQAANAFYDSINSKYLPTLTGMQDKAAWGIFKQILTIIPNPERVATLQLRYLRSRPRVWSPCCNREHCFRCKIKDFHEGKTCEEYSATLSSDIVLCPSCGVSLVKGDGCNSITCLCGTTFSWSGELETTQRCAKFLESFPDATSLQCAKVLCAEQAGELIEAKAWQRRHQHDVNQELLRWWTSKHTYYASQACVVLDVSRLPEGYKLASSLWKKSHSKEIDECHVMKRAMKESLFITMYPNENERARAAVLLLRGHHRPEGKITRSRCPALVESAEIWRQRHEDEYKREGEEYEKRSAAQFLYLYGNCRTVQQYFGHSTLVVTQFSQELSCTDLTFSNDYTTVQRVGSVSTYPAAFAELQGSTCQFTVRIDHAPLTMNMLSFGLAKKGMAKSGSNGVGPTRNTWGMYDERGSGSSSRFFRVSSGGVEVERYNKKFQVGDVLAAVVDTEQGWLELSLESEEYSHRYMFEIPPEQHTEYVFAMTFANDHKVTVLDSLPSPTALGATTNTQIENADNPKTSSDKFADMLQGSRSAKKEKKISPSEMAGRVKEVGLNKGSDGKTGAHSLTNMHKQMPTSQLQPSSMVSMNYEHRIMFYNLKSRLRKIATQHSAVPLDRIEFLASKWEAKCDALGHPFAPSCAAASAYRAVEPVLMSILGPNVPLSCAYEEMRNREKVQKLSLEAAAAAKGHVKAEGDYTHTHAQGGAGSRTISGSVDTRGGRKSGLQSLVSMFERSSKSHMATAAAASAGHNKAKKGGEYVHPRAPGHASVPALASESGAGAGGGAVSRSEGGSGTRHHGIYTIVNMFERNSKSHKTQGSPPKIVTQASVPEEMATRSVATATAVNMPPQSTLYERARVTANWRGRGKYYPGYIAQENNDGTYDVNYDDGERETRVDAFRIIPHDGIEIEYRDGDRVEVNYRGKGKYYPGRIQRARPYGRYDISYDDGEQESCVLGSLIRDPSGPAEIYAGDSLYAKKTKKEEGEEMGVNVSPPESMFNDAPGCSDDTRQSDPHLVMPSMSEGETAEIAHLGMQLSWQEVVYAIAWGARAYHNHAQAEARSVDESMKSCGKRSRSQP